MIFEVIDPLVVGEANVIKMLSHIANISPVDVPSVLHLSVLPLPEAKNVQNSVTEACAEDHLSARRLDIGLYL